MSSDYQVRGNLSKLQQIFQSILYQETGNNTLHTSCLSLYKQVKWNRSSDKDWRTLCLGINTAMTLICSKTAHPNTQYQFQASYRIAICRNTVDVPQTRKHVYISLLGSYTRPWYKCNDKKNWYKEMKRSLTIVVGNEAAQTPSRLRVRSSTPDATTYK